MSITMHKWVRRPCLLHPHARHASCLPSSPVLLRLRRDHVHVAVCVHCHRFQHGRTSAPPIDSLWVGQMSPIDSLTHSCMACTARAPFCRGALLVHKSSPVRGRVRAPHSQFPEAAGASARVPNKLERQAEPCPMAGIPSRVHGVVLPRRAGRHC